VPSAQSYREVDELLVERGFDVDHLLIFWWVQRFTPLLIEATRPCGMAREGQIVTIETDDTTLRVYAHRDLLIKTIPRTSRKEIPRHKAYDHTTDRKTG
jgi:transposase-like protein